MQGAFAKSVKAAKELGGLPDAKYWLHGGHTVPDQSAEHAPGPRAGLMNWYKGPIHPHVELPGMTESYAPAVVKSRMASGNYGSLDFKVLFAGQ